VAPDPVRGIHITSVFFCVCIGLVALVFSIHITLVVMCFSLHCIWFTYVEVQQGVAQDFV